MIKKLRLVIETVRFLKWKQIRYQVIYRLNKAGKLSGYNAQYDSGKVCPLQFSMLPPVYRSVLQANKNHFVFLNLEKQFDRAIDWNFQEYGKLWNYNLQYGNYLLQKDIELAKKEQWLRDIYAWLDDGRLVLEPYPASLRSINVMRLASMEKELLHEHILSHLHAELDFLSNRLEFHLLGNHLLENLFALLMGGAFLGDPSWVGQSEELLQQQLKEQVLPDGGHFELSPMYHQIILFRLLELIDWYRYWQGKKAAFENFIRKQAEKMLAWLNQMSFRNGDIPYLNDSTGGIAYPVNWLLDYGANLGLHAETDWQLRESGYRKYCNDLVECIVDVGRIGASYQPGHAHADSLNFVFNFRGCPIVVDTGISTYEKNARRQLERSTNSHNTITVNRQNSSEVWSGFRVGKRAVTKIIEENENSIIARHDGYKSLGVIHQRSFEVKKNELIIEDLLVRSTASGFQKPNIVGYIHFHPQVSVEREKNTLLINNQLKLIVDNASSVGLESYQYAGGYNELTEAKRVVYTTEENSILLKFTVL